MGVFSRKKVTEDVPVEEKRQEEAKTASSVKVYWREVCSQKNCGRNIRFVLFATFLGIWYISNGYSTEKLHRERVLLEKEVTDLRFESISAAADLMLMRKQSEIIKRIKNEGLALEESKEPPVKLYR